MSVDLLNMLTEYAKKYHETAPASIVRNHHMNDLQTNDVIEQSHTDAVLVDFINFIGAKHGVDYALYTSDLKNK